MAGYIIKVTLEGTHPPVWRRIAIPDRLFFSDLHRILQVAFGWRDMHLHEFSFPNLEVCVGDLDNGDDYDIFPEEEAVVDDFFSTNPWMRYTYDFGDDWRHRVAFEKEDSSYSLRYGTILKAKGKNFEEDSGGVWGEAQQEEEYNIQAVNRILAQMEVPLAPPSPRSAAAAKGEFFYEEHGLEEDFPEGELEEEVGEEELNQAFQWMERLYFQARREYELLRANPPSSSALGKMRTAWTEFCNDWDAWEEWASEASESYNQEGYFLDKRVTGQTRRNILGKASQAELRDYCRYLQIPWKKSWNKKELVEQILKCLEEHPEYVIYVLEEEELAALLKFCQEPEGRLEALEDRGCIERAIALGMVEICIEHGAGGAEIACLEIPKEAQEFLLGLKGQDWTLVYQKLAAVSEKIRRLVVAYGVLEVGDFCRMFGQDGEIQAGQEELLRVLYWHCRFQGLIQAMRTEDGKEYVASVDLEIEDVMRDRLRYASGVEYPMFTAQELGLRAGESVEAIPGWRRYDKYLQNVYGLEEEFLAEWLNITCTDVRNGESSTQLILDALELYEPSNLMEWTELWLCLMEICMDTGLPMLMGYSRAEFEEATGRPACELGLFDIDLEEFEEELQANDHLFMLPAEWQYQLFLAGKSQDGSHSLECMEQVLEKSGGNYEVAFLMMRWCMHGKKRPKARRLAQELKGRLPGQDVSLEEALRLLET